ncbi:MAG TPA: VWA domain-containing protein [Dehalococcoidia bacterium]|nr:VWA domain-containing protein [Dehalococcoidia bacterium]
MTLAAPGYLLLLLLSLPPVAAVLAWSAWRRRVAGRFGGARRSGAAALAAPMLLLGALGLAAFAAARPQSDTGATAAAARGIDAAIVLDVSQSMLATDAAPTRLGRAQQEISALLAQLTGDRVGLVVFAGTPFVRAPLTSDLAALDEMVRGVGGERALVGPGSDPAGAIAVAQQVLSRGDARTKAMLIVSDGEDHGAGVSPAVAAARSAGVRVYTAGVGTAEGAPVRDLDPLTGASTTRLGSGGAPVITRLDAPALREIALSGGGRYVALSGDGHPLASLAAEFAALPATTFSAVPGVAPTELAPLFAGIALAIVVSAMLLPFAAAWRRAARWLPLAGAGIFLGALCSTGVGSVNRAGNQAYDTGDYAGAIALYRTAQALDPAHAALYYNAGNAYQRNGDASSAIDETMRAIQAGDSSVLARAEYALGNHLVAAGRLSDAAQAYRRALLADPAGADAKHNLEVVEAMLSAASTTPAVPGAQPTPPAGATPGARGAGAASGSGAAGAPPRAASPDPRSLPPDELRRELADALAASQRPMTEEQALRALQLLDEANRRADSQQSVGGGGLPDY